MKSSAIWAEAHVQSVRDLTPTVREFTIRPTTPAAPYAPGSHLQMEVLVDGQPQVRSYSLVGAPDGAVYRIAVKRLDDGRGGSLAMWRLGVGDRLRVGDYDILVSLDNRIDFLPATGEEQSAAKHLDSDIGHSLNFDNLLTPREPASSDSFLRNSATAEAASRPS